MTLFGVIALVLACAPVVAVTGGAATSAAAPLSATDERAIPHYFGPYANWANSPQVLPNALVTIEGPRATARAAGSVDALHVSDFGSGYVHPLVAISAPTLLGGTQATATASVDGGGRVVLTLVNRGSGYVAAPTVVITESSPGVTPSHAAAATATLRIDQVAVLVGAAGYTSLPVVTIVDAAPGGIGTGARAVGGSLGANGALTTVTVTAHGAGYTTPRAVVAPSETHAEASATVDPKDGSITAIDVTNPAAGYTAAPTITISAPGAHQEPFVQATASATPSAGAIHSVDVTAYGFGYSAPIVTFDPASTASGIASGSVDDLTLVSGGADYITQPVVEFSLPDLPDGVRATGTAVMNAEGVVSSVAIVDAGSGYTKAPTVRVLDGATVNTTPAVVQATIDVTTVTVTDFGSGYASPPTVTISDTTHPVTGVPGDGDGAVAEATVTTLGAITQITITNPGSGYLTPGLRKFVDTLSGLGAGKANDLGNYLPVAQPDTTTYPGTDYYEIGVVQYRHQFHSNLPPTLVRGYVQLSTSAVQGLHVALTNANLDPDLPASPVVLNGEQVYGVDAPHYLGPTILATKNRPTRILFRNLLPTGSGGDLFLPVDTTLMGAGSGPGLPATEADPNPDQPVGAMMLNPDGTPMDMADDQGTVLDGVRNPVCNNSPKPAGCYTENRSELHLHGGVTPWISDGTPHQWITPADEGTIYPKGVSVSNVPDMPDPGPGAMTFFYTNQQSARLMFYHDHAWGITRLNVYAGEAAPYIITDATEQRLFGEGAPFSDLGVGTPLVIQDKTFVPSDDVIAAADPTWNSARWGGEGSLWTPHVYMPAQNPGDPTGMSSYGRWMYGPWFWPPATSTKYAPIANPYYDPACDPEVAQFCEPAQIPGTPNVSVGMEAFNDTPIVNGTAYPTTTVDPKAYRFRVLNAANDRFWNLSWYVADPTTGTLSEVALKPAEVEAAQTDPNVFPTPDTTKSPPGPSWVQIGTEGGFLPTPTIVPAQPTTWITDPTRFDVGNVDQHSLLLAPAERADVIVDFSQYRGKTLILYNDAPAAFPARVAGYDYYTGGPDLRPSGAPTTLPGYGPNTRTVMQVKVSSKAPATAFDRPGTNVDRLGTLMNMFAHNNAGTGVFESGQHAPIVGQAAYNTALGTDFVSAGWCNSPTNASSRCDGYARVLEQGGSQFKFDTVDRSARATTTVASVPNGLEAVDFNGQPGSPTTLSVAASTTGFGNTGRITVTTEEGPVTLSYTGLDVAKALSGILKEQSTVTAVTFTGVRRVSGSGPIDSGATVAGPVGQLAVPLEPKGMHDEMNSATFDEFGRMTANLGLEAPGITPLTQNIILYTYSTPATEILKSADFPSTVDVTPISSAADGTQIWKITHNGVDTHPIHFHLYDVQLINRVTWDNIVIPPDPSELGWKDTVRVSPLEDTIVAVRPIIPVLPFAIPDSRRPLNPMMPLGAKGNQTGPNGSQAGFNNTDVTGAAIAPIVNTVENFHWEYVFHCHILSHEEMDMMRPVNVDVTWLAPSAPTGVASAVDTDGVGLQWTDPTPMSLDDQGQVDLITANATMERSEIGFRIDRRVHGTSDWTAIDTAVANATAYTDLTGTPGVEYDYRIVSWNEAGSAASDVVASIAPALAPSGLTATIVSGPLGIRLDWLSSGDDSATSLVVERSADGGAYSTIATLTPTGSPAALPLTFTDHSIDSNVTYRYRVHTDGPSGPSATAGPVAVLIDSTTTVLTSSPAPSALGQSVTFTAHVTTTRPATVPTGTVTFTANGTSTPVALDGSGVAQYTTAGLPVGGNTVTAAYGGSTVGAPVSLHSSSATMTHVVVRGTPTVAVDAPASSTYGRSATFTATVTPSSATGTITFVFDQGLPSVASHSVNVVSGAASYSTATLTIGTHTVRAVYNGDGNYTSATSSPADHVVNGEMTTVSLQTSSNPAQRLNPLTFTARVTSADTGLPVSVGFVTITMTVPGGAVSESSSTVDAGGRVTWTPGSLPPGSSLVVATFHAVTPWVDSVSSRLTQVVTRTPSTLTLRSAGATVFGQAAVFTATVNDRAARGTVTFVIDGTKRIAVAVGSTGVASLPFKTLAVGAHRVTATYAGDTLHLPSSAPGIRHTVARAATTVRIVPIANPVRAGSKVTLTITVRAVGPASGAPTGRVRLVVDGWLVRDLTLGAGGTATFSTYGLVRGSHNATAAYLGSGNFFPSSTTMSPRLKLT